MVYRNDYSLCFVLVGGFSLNNQYPGEWACMNVWDREMSAEEVKSVTCCDQGNLVNSGTLKIAGDEDRSGEASVRELIGTASTLKFRIYH